MWPSFVMSWELRQALTRSFCWALLVVHALACLLTLALLAAILLQPSWFMPLFWPTFAIFFLSIVLSLVLSAWRRCDACGLHLYGQKFVGFSGLISRWNKAPRPVDYRAKLVLQSYWLGALVEMATTGKAHCQQCGHADGDPKIEQLRQ